MKLDFSDLPGVGRLEGLPIQDIAPTILKLFELSIPQAMDAS
jgi:hypothetical protein